MEGTLHASEESPAPSGKSNTVIQLVASYVTEFARLVKEH